MKWLIPYKELLNLENTEELHHLIIAECRGFISGYPFRMERSTEGIVIKQEGLDDRRGQETSY